MNRTVRLISALVLTATLVAATLCLCACSKGEEEAQASQSGVTVSGRVSQDGAPLAGVSVLVGKTARTTTNEYGIFTVKGLDKGDVLSFSLDGYSFKPATYVVDKAINDLSVVAERT